MMDNTVYTKRYSAPPWNRREILRYAGAKETTEEVSALLEDCLAEAEGVLNYQLCYARFPVREEDGILDLGFTRVTTDHLRKNLCGCNEIVLFGATVGLGMDRAIARYGKLSPARALMFQAIGAERIEALCDAFCDELSREVGESGMSVRPRFSPGYGDVPLELQRDIFRVLDCARKIGLTLNDSLLMTPTKSVTALVGVGKSLECAEKVDCSACKKEDCLYRRNL
jgi:5-methyltetrahydrofolate--homocysteine methyltransferase